MTKPFGITLAFTLLLALSNTAAAETAHESARSFVAQSHAGDDLAAIALSAAKHTQTYGTLVAKLGAVGADTAVSSEITALLPQYQPKWDQNLAAAYEKSFSSEELSSLASKGRDSKYAGKVIERQSAIGKDMQSSSGPILISLITEALEACLSKNGL
ncbi:MULTISPECIES: hypothetical protein [Pseudomonas]|uniref:DUF4142 domain-containing protein n=1 Tax=Pseudomonas gingeri TaxID=117681 RepID=A0A7Y7WVQ2_9PSED|nr:MULTISPECIES: hypothetical protein [Pseudomonas]MPQ66629.1 hypothetical protein [Pseudomonas sp. MWU12-2323]NWB88285.1 hypothetical protein [Pseudomonas gingeri]RBH60083.1 hypothetical protein C3F00_003200 [Pseudomonas sp. MWU13-2860]